MNREKTRRRQWLRNALGVLLVLLVGLPVLTRADTPWSPPCDVSGWQNYIRLLVLRLGGDNSQAVVWQVDETNLTWSLWARSRSASGVWGPAENISGVQEPFNNTLPFYWDAGIAPDGTVWIVWASIDTAQVGDNVRVMISRLVPGGAWQTEALTAWHETTVRWVDLHIGPDGDLAAAWVACASSTDPSQGPCHVRVRRRPDGASGWTAVEQPDQTVGGGISRASVLVGPGGLTVALWTEADTSLPANWALMARAFEPSPAPGAWEPGPVNISGWKPIHPIYSWPLIAPDGTVTAGWSTTTSDPLKTAVYASTRWATTGTWDSPPIRISSIYTGSGLSYPRLGVGQNGSVAAGWAYQPTGTEGYILANARDAGSGWDSETLVLGGAGYKIDYVSLGIRMLPEGAALLVYSYQDTTRPASEDEMLRWIARSRNGSWGDVGNDELGPWAAEIWSPALSSGDDGSAVVLWVLQDATRPAGEQWLLLAATWPMGGPFETPVVVAEGYNEAYTAGLSGAVVGVNGSPKAAAWVGQRVSDGRYAVFHSQITSSRNYLPQVVK